MLAAHDLSFAVGSKQLVDSVTLQVQAGEMVALLGPNGAGKSTLLKMLCGQSRPTSGHVSFEGRGLGEWAPRALARRRAVLPQSSAVPFEFTALEIVLLGRSPHGDASAHEAMARQAMEKTESLHLADRTVTTLSGGEMQRVQLARVLVQIGLAGGAPRCLMLDEPISNLDPAHQHSALQIARELAADGAAVLIVLHDLNLAAQYATRLVLMRMGKIVADGSPGEVLTEEQIGSVFGVKATVVRNPRCDAPAVFVGLQGIGLTGKLSSPSMDHLMKPAFVLLCVFGVLSLGGCATTAKQPATVEALFKRADKSGDGRVSRAEFEDFMIENMFASFDSNGDGYITEAEFVADGGTVKTFREINVSGTGKITIVEAKSSKLIRNRLAAPFTEADVNGNGSVTWEEFQAARAKARAYVRQNRRRIHNGPVGTTDRRHPRASRV